MRNIKRQAGFTLIELMIAVLVVSILVAIALPTYSNSVRKARRTEAKNALLDLASREERFFNTNPSIGYTNVAANLGYAAAGATTTMDTALPVGSYYNVTVTNIALGTTTTAPTYTLTATAIGDQLKDTSCRTFVVTQAGVQTSADSSATDTTSTCWR